MTGTEAGSSEPEPAILTAQEAEALARRHGMTQVGQRPTLGGYLADLWRNRHLMWAMAKGDFIASHQDNHLGLLWSVINPLLLAVSYYLIFGLLIGTRGGIENFVSFLTIGLFIFIPISSAMTSGGKSVTGKVGMIRSLKFPRVLLPVTSMLSEFLGALPAFVTLVVIALAMGERPSLQWLLFPVALLVVLAFCLGLSMICARLVDLVRDASNLLPLTVRLLRYVSGIFFSVQDSLARFDSPPRWVAYALEYQPVAVMLTLVREPLMEEFAVRWQTWAVAGGWAVLFLVVGFVVFWRGEGSYGRG
ncbi:ABC transporter permease [Ornithinimicrobium panacihumi]|uniref:ABC transporter permease n=1 Tax=Ornithinimicrobium panacihumi TaxID=2008449 RepID=UPI003F896A09